eukprot:2007-Eustigmatos_ZCMA.PRE.1
MEIHGVPYHSTPMPSVSIFGRWRPYHTVLWCVMVCMSLQGPSVLQPAVDAKGRTTNTIVKCWKGPNLLHLPVGLAAETEECVRESVTVYTAEWAAI